MIIILLFTALLHPVHETVSEIEWNPVTRRLEVAVRLHVLDEQWIRRQVDREADLQSVAIAYLKKHFRVGADPASVQSEFVKDVYHWIGREEDGSHVWWYFEIEPVGHAEPRMLRSIILLEHDKSYVNRIVVLSRVPKLAQTLTIARPEMDLSPRANEDDLPAKE